MKKIFKKNQVIITALAIMIAVAGYINYSDSHLGMDRTLKNSEDSEKASADTKEIVEEIESLDYDLTDETALLEENEKATEKEETTEQEETPGEAVLTGSSNFVAQAKVNREQVRSANKETLLEIINNENLGEEQKQAMIKKEINEE